MAEPNNNQMAFWEAMREKYERRNESLKQQEACLQKRLEQLRQIMESQKVGDECDCVPEKLEKPSLVQCLVEKGKNLILGTCKCGDPKIGENLLCACHIEDPNAPINIDPNLCPKQETSSLEGCLNPTCDFYDPTLAKTAENPSTFSLKTTDIFYMDKLADLVKSEKHMQEKIEDLEKRELSYLTAIHDLQEAMKKQPKPAPINNELKKLTKGLEEENKKLRNELQDLRLELKHCFERVEGPLRRSLDEQRDKCTKLEKRLKDLQEKTKMKEDSYVKEINEVKAKLCQACCTMVDLNNVNSRLKQDLGALQNKCASLEDELLKQQLKEAENILRFKNAISRRNGPKNKIQAKGDESEQDLGEIAKKLGDTLKEVCPCVSDVPSGLAETAENIRQLTELVVEKGAKQKKRKVEKIRKASTSTCSCAEDFIEKVICVTPQKPPEEDSCSCSHSSLKLRPKIGNKEAPVEQPKHSSSHASSKLKQKIENDAVPVEKPKKSSSKRSSSASLPSVHSNNIGQPKSTSTPRSSLKKTTTKGCTCCPSPEDCDQIEKKSTELLCLCPDMGNKKTGPSEEVIAVKTLGTLSIPREEIEALCINELNMTKFRKEKLVADTTCDILNTPATDINIVTTVAKTGSLEITTEGPPGIIETKVNYLPDGKLEIVTKLIDRNNMTKFLDGTLLLVPEGPPECEESHTCGGQCEIVLPGCPEIDCHQSRTCGGVCSEEADVTVDNSGKEEETKEQEESPPYGQVIINNNFTVFTGGAKDLLGTKQWKNTNFQVDVKEEALLEDMSVLEKAKCRRKEKPIIHADVTSEQEVLRLSSKQSLTDVEKCTKEEKQVSAPANSASPDVLDTISEVDEELSDLSKTEHDGVIVEEYGTPEMPSSKTEKVNDLNAEETVGREGHTVFVAPKEEHMFSQSNMISAENEHINENQDITMLQPQNIMKNDIAKEVETENNNQSEILPTEIKEDTEQSKIVDVIYESKKENGDILETSVPKEAEISIHRTLEVSELTPLLHSEVQSTETSTKNENLHENQVSLRHPHKFHGIEVSQVSTNWQITRSFCELSRNLNFPNGKLILKQSKSMYEKRGTTSEYLKICKSATLSLGNLKIDLEKLRLSSKGPKVGDFGELQQEIQAVRTNDERQSCCIGAKDKIVSEVLREGNDFEEKSALQFKNSFTGLQTIETFPQAFEQSYQCYVCRCSRKKDKDNQQRNNQNPRSDEDLERRIDRLLEIDPLANTHGVDCPCIDCLLLNVQKTNMREDCKCSRKKQDRQKKPEKTIPKKEEPASSKTQKDETQHGENCTCVDCICNPCNFKKLATCDCKTCECDSCIKDGLSKTVNSFGWCRPQEITVMNVNMTCGCGVKCPCDACIDERKRKTPRETQKPQQTKSKESSNKTKSTAPPVNLSDTWKNVVNCCCSPPSDVKKAVCNCGTCECKPWKYAEQKGRPCVCKPEKRETEAQKKGSEPPKKGHSPPQEEPKTSSKVPKQVTGECDCNICKCAIWGTSNTDDSKGDTNTNLNKSIKCDCQLCDCLFCSKPKDQKDPKSVEVKEKPTMMKKVTPDSPQQMCGCRPKCFCKSCPVFAEQIGDTRGKNCDCTKCECDPCLGPDSLAAKNVKDFLRQQKINDERKLLNFDKKVPCDCKPCECEICMAKIQEARGRDKNKEDKPQDETEKRIYESKSGKGEHCPCMLIGGNSPTEECKNCGICCPESSDDKKEEECVPKQKAQKVDAVPKKMEKPTTPKSGESKRCPCMVIGGNSPLEECKNCGICCFPEPIDKEEETCAPRETQKEDSADKKIEKPKFPSNSGKGEQCPCMKIAGNSPMEDCKDCGICCPSPASTMKPAVSNPMPEPTKSDVNKAKREEVLKQMPCDCCTCAPCSDPTVMNENGPQMIGDADRAREELKNVLDKIGCTCDEVEVNFKPLVKQASNFETTVSKMKLKLNNLQQKCKDKDQIIDAMTNELSMRSQSGVFADLLYDLAHPKQRFIPDYNRTYVCDLLPKPRHLGAKYQQKRSSISRFNNKLEPILEVDRYLPGAKDDAYICPKNLDVTGLEIIDIRRVTIDSILIKWRSPPRVYGVNGYQIFINDELKYRVLSPNRTNAVIDSLDLSCSLEIMLYAITSCGRCEPPALATYKI